MNGKVDFKGRMLTTLRGPIYLGILFVALNVAVYFWDILSGVIVSVFVLIYLISSVAFYSRSREGLYREFINLSKYFDKDQIALIDKMDIPYVTLGTDGKILWMNAKFMQDFDKDETYHKAIAGVFPSLSKEILAQIDTDETITLERSAHYYRAHIRRMPVGAYNGEYLSAAPDDDSSYIFTMYLIDQTKRYELIQKYEEEKLAVALIYIDNYDDVVENVEEIKASLITALIDKRISQYFDNKDAIIKKFDHDKYMVIFKQHLLDGFKNNKFSILETTKEVKVGNGMAVTLSIGVGAKGKDYISNYNYAKAAIDVALGRGGDQAVLKENEDISYYGNKSRHVEKVTRVKARIKAQALQEILSACEQVLIMGHHIGDVDSFGSAIGIYRAASLLGKEAHVVLDEITSSIRPMKAMFSVETGYPANMFLTPEQAISAYNKHTVVMVVDCNKPSYTECPQLLEMADEIVVFDHHLAGKERVENAVLSYVEPYASSACEMVTEVLQYFSEDIRLSEAEADCLYGGIIIDTNNFTTKTGVRTFEAAAYLRRAGANVERVRKMLQNDMEAYRARAEAVRRAEAYHGEFAISVCPTANVESPTVVGAQAANELLNIIGIKASFVLTEYQDKIYVSSRSIDEIDVQSIMEKLGGGGHLNVAGAQLKGLSLEEAEDFIKNTLDDMIEKGDIKL